MLNDFKYMINIKAAFFFILFFGDSSNLYSQDSFLSKQILSYGNVNFITLNFKLNLFDSLQDLKEDYAYLKYVRVDTFKYLSDGNEVFCYIAYPSNYKGKMPCILFNRGGNQDFSLISMDFVVYNLCEIASAGFVVAATTYRGNSKSSGKDEFGGGDVNDIQNLIAVLPSFEMIDTNRLGMYGWSRGGLMTYMMLRRTDKVKAAIIGGGPSDLFKLIDERPEMETEVFEQLIPNYLNDKSKELIKRSPIFWADEMPKIPILIIHGQNDKRVPLHHAVDLYNKIKIHNSLADLKIYTGEDHGISGAKADLRNTVIEYFTKHL